MLSLFPSLLTFQLLAPFILRVVLGVIFVNFGWTKIGRQKPQKADFFNSIGLKPGILFVWIIGILEIVAGGFLIAGFLTQLGALIATLISACALILIKKHPTAFESNFGFMLLCLAISLSLVFTGPGFFAFDLPL